MTASQQNPVQDLNPKNSGFALITVLFSLAVITLLLTVSQQQVMRNIEALSSQKIIASKPLKVRSILQAYLVANDPRNGPASVGYDGETYRVEVQNVGGLIDVNAASMELIEILLGALDVADARRTLAMIEARRQSNDPFMSLLEFSSEIGIAVAELTDLATVYSGRSGVDPREVSKGVSELLGAQVPNKFIAESSKSINHVSIKNHENLNLVSMLLRISKGELKATFLTIW